ncbi:MAG TPA: DUF4080 domain-containing protein [Verrucomicrobiae bacterium]|nr:DUF4080 domain-containing protein [Verrucomicrobiae bacterium]
MPDIVLSTLNAKYIHAAFGLRYLFANLGELQSRAALAEFDINQRPLDIAEALLARNPRIIGLGVYIWNVTPTTELVATLKRIRPEIIIVLGGPEVSHETEQQPIVQLADHVITGEGDLEFTRVCGKLLECWFPDRPKDGEAPARSEPGAPLPKILPAPLPDFSQLKLPYDCYTDADIAHRVLYVEASRGCPFSCEFCLSSLDVPVRQAPLPEFLAAMQRLLDRGATQLKFVDRTFNLNVATSRAILEFCLRNCQPGRFFHFEMVPDRLPEALREIIAKFPPGALQFEIGVQTFDEPTAARISRRQNYARLGENFCWLRNHTGVHLHADLIAGLPGESLESFGAGFDRLVALGPQEIQVGILKRLRGTPIVRHDSEWAMVYNPHPPYEILQNRLLDFAVMQRLRRFARYWDLVGNSGNFVATTPLIWAAGSNYHPSACANERLNMASDATPQRTGAFPAHPPSPFHSFLRWSDWLFAQIGRTDSIALNRLAELLFNFLTGERRLDAGLVAEALWRDYQRGGRRDQPEFLRPLLPSSGPKGQSGNGQRTSLKRQARHLA